MFYRSLLPTCLTMLAANVAAAEDTRVFELRTYWTPEGKLDALHARFRDHTTKLFAKHGMTNVGYWVPVENSERKLIYVLAYPSRDAREKAWKAFFADPEWQQVQKASEAEGKLVDKVESRFLSAADYSPVIEPSQGESRVFELRTYTTTPGNLPALHDRFRQHTMKLFKKHGMTNIAYWTLTPDQDDAQRTLIYMLAHASKEARDKSFAAFRDDPNWVAARQASEEKAGGSLTEKDGVKSVLLKATDYSPIR